MTLNTRTFLIMFLQGRSLQLQRGTEDPRLQSPGCLLAAAVSGRPVGLQLHAGPQGEPERLHDARQDRGRQEQVDRGHQGGLRQRGPAPEPHLHPRARDDYLRQAHCVQLLQQDAQGAVLPRLPVRQVP